VQFSLVNINGLSWPFNAPFRIAAKSNRFSLLFTENVKKLGRECHLRVALSAVGSRAPAFDPGDKKIRRKKPFYPAKKSYVLRRLKRCPGLRRGVKKTTEGRRDEAASFNVGG